MKRPSPGIDCCCWSIVFLSLAQAVPVARGPNSGEPQRLEAANSNYVDLNKVCLYESAVYAEGQNFTTSNPCETCICHPPAFACSLRTCDMKPGCKAIHSANKCCPEYSCECERNGEVYGNGEKVEEPNPCKICYCKGGEIKCSELTCYTREDCEPVYTPGICCPKYDHCPLLESLKNQTNTPKRSLVKISDLSTPGVLENKNTSSEETSSEIQMETTESPKPNLENSTQPQTVATLEIIEIHPSLSTTTPTYKEIPRPKFHSTTKAPEEESTTPWTESGSIATEEISNDFETTQAEITKANDTQPEVSTVPFDVKDLPPIDSNDLNLARMRNQSDDNDTLSEESGEVAVSGEVNNGTSVDEDYEKMENSTSDAELPARIEGEATTGAELPSRIEEEAAAAAATEQESMADAELPARMEGEVMEENSTGAELPSSIEEATEQELMVDTELPARIEGEVVEENSTAGAELPARIEGTMAEENSTTDAEISSRIEEATKQESMADAELPVRIEEPTTEGTITDRPTTEEPTTIDDAEHADLRNEETTTTNEESTKTIDKESIQLGEDISTDNYVTTTEVSRATDEDLIERITVEDLIISTIAPIVESTTVTESNSAPVRLEEATTEIAETTTETLEIVEPTSITFDAVTEFVENARYVASTEEITTTNLLEKLESTTVTYESTTFLPTTESEPPLPTGKLSGRMISDDSFNTTEDPSSEELDEGENISAANDSAEIQESKETESSAEELTTKRPAVYSTYAPYVDRITIVPPEKIQEETTTEPPGEQFENASISEENFDFDNSTSGESSEDTSNSTNVPFKYPAAEDGAAPVVVMISADQMQFLKVGEEPPLYVENPSPSSPQENVKNNREEMVIVPKTTPLTVEMIKVVNGKIENQTEEIDFTTENQNLTNEYLISKTDSIPTAEEDPTTKETLTNEETSSNATGIIPER